MSENYFMGLDGFVWFTGVVEDRNDPDALGRVRVRCLGFHTEDLNDIPTKDLPWATVMHPVTDPSMQGLGNSPSFLVEGTWVVGLGQVEFCFSRNTMLFNLGCDLGRAAIEQKNDLLQIAGSKNI